MALSDIAPLSRAEIATAQQILVSVGLPSDDCFHSSNRFFGIHDAGRLIACGGLQDAGGEVLLRSVAVLTTYRDRGLGRQLIDFLLEQAEKSGFGSIYLLTETADQYFKSLGFEVIDRIDTPAGIQATEQFSTLCPSSAVCLTKQLSA